MVLTPTHKMPTNSFRLSCLVTIVIILLGSHISSTSARHVAKRDTGPELRDDENGGNKRSDREFVVEEVYDTPGQSNSEVSGRFVGGDSGAIYPATIEESDDSPTVQLLDLLRTFRSPHEKRKRW